MLLALGMFAFALPTLAFDELQRRCSYTHAVTPRIGERDATQFVGIGPETIAINGTAYAELSDGPASLEQLREMAASGDAWSLVDGTGLVYGAYVIVGVDQRGTALFADGTARKIDFGIDLLRVDKVAVP